MKQQFKQQRSVLTNKEIKLQQLQIEAKIAKTKADNEYDQKLMITKKADLVRILLYL